MSKRAAAAEETRRKIIAATEELHTTRGILETSWDDIAQHAGVAVGTVYRYFPSYDELLPACGEVSLARLALPSPEESRELFAGVRGRRARLRRLVEELFAAYERGEGVLNAVRDARHALPFIQQAHEHNEEQFDALARTAAEPLDLSADELRVLRALTDLDVWRALRTRGITGEAAIETTVELLDAWLARRRR